MDGCYDVPEGTKGSAPIVMRALNGGWTACLVARVAVTQMTVISDLWDRLVTAALSHPDIELADHPAYEIYRAASDGAAFDITLCLPLIKQPRGVKS